VSLHAKKDQVKKIEKGDTLTKFWNTLKNLDPSMDLSKLHVHGIKKLMVFNSKV
jgi:hypothetical protein